jgi:hypothetical protein
VAEHLRLAVLAAYQRLFGLELEHLAVDGCITKVPCGGQVAGPSPVDRRKQGWKRSIVTDAGGIPLGAVPAAAKRRDDGLLGATLDTLAATSTVIGPLPVQASRRWPVEPTHAWGNQYGKLRWCTERRRIVVEFWLALGGVAIVCGRLLLAPGPTIAGRADHGDAPNLSCNHRPATVSCAERAVAIRAGRRARPTCTSCAGTCSSGPLVGRLGRSLGWRGGDTRAVTRH